NHPQQAEGFYAKALSTLGDRPEAAPALTYLGFRSTDPAAALDYFQRAQRLDPSHAGPVLRWMALLQERQNNPAQAEELYRSGLSLDSPDSVDAANTMQLSARFLNAQGREEEAKSMQARAAAIRNALSQSSARSTASTALRVGAGVSAPTVVAKVDP